MPGPLRADKTRFTFALWRSTAAWLNDEAGRVGVTASDVARAAIAHFRAEAPAQRERTIRATASEHEEEGDQMPGPRR